LGAYSRRPVEPAPCKGGVLMRERWLVQGSSGGEVTEGSDWGAWRLLGARSAR